MTRGEALALGLKRYDSGKSCPQGHPGVKYTCTSSCVECVRVARDARRAAQRAVMFDMPRLPEVSIPLVQIAIRTQPTSVWGLAR